MMRFYIFIWFFKFFFFSRIRWILNIKKNLNWQNYLLIELIWQIQFRLHFQKISLKVGLKYSDLSFFKKLYYNKIQLFFEFREERIKYLCFKKIYMFKKSIKRLNKLFLNRRWHLGIKRGRRLLFYSKGNVLIRLILPLVWTDWTAIQRDDRPPPLPTSQKGYDSVDDLIWT